MVEDATILVEKLRQAAGPNLKSVVLYGSAASGEFHPDYSDVNVLSIVESSSPDKLEALHPAVSWWMKKGNPAPLVFSPEDLRRSADVFAIEMLDIKANHRLLFGEDYFSTLHVPMNLHRVQVEHELRTKWLRLRQLYLAHPKDRKALLDVMTASVSTFAILFRHALIALGEDRLQQKRDVFETIAAKLNLDAGPFHKILDIREKRRKASEVDVIATFRAYLDAVTRVADEVDRRLAQ